MEFCRVLYRVTMHAEIQACARKKKQDMADQKEDREAFLALAEGEVVDDLTGPAEEHDRSSDADEETQAAPAAAGFDVPDDSIHIFEGHTEPIYAVAWNSLSETLVSTGGGDDRAYLWQCGEEAFLQEAGSTMELTGHTDSVSCLAFNSSGRLLASGGLDGQVRIWEAESGQCIYCLDGPLAGIEWLCWHPRGDIVLAGSEDFTAWMWNAQTGICMQVLTGHRGPVRCGAFTPDGRTIVTGGGEGDESLKIWNPRTGECTLSIQDPHHYHSAGLTVLAMHPDSATICSGSEDTTAKLVNVQTGRILGSLNGHTDSIEAIVFSTQLPLVATSSVDGDIRIWDSSNMATRSICHHAEAVVRLICHPSQPLLYSACLDGAVRCWDLRTGTCIAERTGHTQGIQDMAISPTGRHVLTGSDDCTARIFSFQ